MVSQENMEKLTFYFFLSLSLSYSHSKRFSGEIRLSEQNNLRTHETVVVVTVIRELS